VSMIEHAVDAGHMVALNTTLVGVTIRDAARLGNIPFEFFILHEPDPQGHAKIPLTLEYLRVKEYIKRHVGNVTTMSMNDCFQSNLSEVTIREMCDRKTFTVNKQGKIGCPRLNSPHFMMMPNGCVTYCCTTRGLTGRIGNLGHESYVTIAARLPALAKKMRNDPNSFCHHCTLAEPWWYTEGMRIKENTFGERKLFPWR